MNAGSKRHLIVVELLTTASPEVRNSYGELEQEYVTAFTAFAAVENYGTHEFHAMDRVHAESTIRFRLYYRPEVEEAEWSANHRIVYNNKNWKITPAIPDNMMAEMTIEASVQE